MENKRVREIFYYGRFYLDFFEKLPYEHRKKFNWILQLMATIEKVPVKFLAHMKGSDGIYEIRIKIRNNKYRVFCFFDEGNKIILMNGFLKKKKNTKERIAFSK